ncbi:hypothetical protein CROQUDRAFT_680507 [Cronartium quercuum f. sp. fusiforme G11]|uniref:Uncharacterized protein n=1 Tax=Cronartium quercuum f. sp. fusiforme G11 TaxID=708437 RepID=A0A9P6NA97_9BASI|nr:hypothetical protein CROQUDRAFT_680507 [Cronartium quercuum f. sp. fusiforme G11]
MIFLGWLHLYCKLSRTNCHIAHKFILKILAIAEDAPLLNQFDHNDVPKDIRTSINKLLLNPDLDEQICCPKCFSLYNAIQSPWRCLYRKSPTSQECGEELFILKTVYRAIKEKGKSQKEPSQLLSLPPTEIGVPRSIFTMQKISSWLQWFLRKPTIKSNIASWSDKLKQESNSQIHDIQQSAAWQDIMWPPSSTTENSDSKPPPLNLVFSLFSDWFNPCGNKNKGKIQLMGILSLNCLNLPPAQ